MITTRTALVAATLLAAAMPAAADWSSPIEICFYNSGAFESRGYIWYGDAGGAKSYDTGRKAVATNSCKTLPAGTKDGATLRVTVNTLASTWPRACNVVIGVGGPYTASTPVTYTNQYGYRQSDSSSTWFPRLTVKVSGTVWSYKCEFCVNQQNALGNGFNERCFPNLPIPFIG